MLWATVERLFRLGPALIYCFLFTALSAKAADVPYTLSYQARILNPAGTAPLLDSGLTFTFGVYYDANGNSQFDIGTDCRLYEEAQSGIDTSVTSGLVSLQIGELFGAAPSKRTVSDPGIAMDKVYANNGPMAVPGCPGGTLNPAAGSGRKLQITITPSVGLPIVLIPDQGLDSVPYATVAQTLQGKVPADFVSVSSNRTDANLEKMVDGSDVASTLHHHDARYDARYASIGSTSSQSFGSGGISSTGNVVTSGSMRVGSTASPTRPFEVYDSGDSQVAFGVSSSGDYRFLVNEGASDGLAFYKAGTLKFNADASGLNLGAGYSLTGVGDYLTFKDATTRTFGFDFQTYDAAASYSSKVRILNNGNVGIGTTSPAPSNASTVIPKLVVDGAGVAHGIQINRNTSVGAGGGILTLSSTRGSSTTSYTALQSGDGIGAIIFGGADGSQFVSSASIGSQVDGAVSANTVPGRLVFNTSSSGANATSERMRIDSSGNVGIGTTAPTGKLDIHMGSTDYGGVRILGENFSAGDTATRLQIKDITGGVNWFMSANNDGKFAIHQGTVGDRLVVDNSNGNVGIGTANPGARLHVSGGELLMDKVDTATAGATVFGSQYARFRASGYSGGVASNIDWRIGMRGAPTAAGSAFEIESPSGKAFLIYESGVDLAGIPQIATQSGTLTVYGRPADGATAVGTKIGSGYSLTTAGSKLVSFINNATEKASIDKDGGMSLSGNLVVAGTLTANGNTILDSSGKIPALTSTYFSSLNGSAITNLGAANISTGNFISTIGLGTHLSFSAGAGTGTGATPTIATDATSANTGSTIVARNASGDFSAGTITATLSGNASTATNASNVPWTGVSGKPTTIATYGITDAITTGNIGTQSVSYATTAGTANAVAGANVSGTVASATNATTLGSMSASSANGGDSIVQRDASGNFSAGTITATVFNYSDRTLKKDIVPIEGALESVLSMRGVRYRWKKDDKQDLGLIAQEVEKVFPELVSTSEVTGIKAVNYANLVGVIIESVKEIYGKLTGVDERVLKLENEIQVLKRELVEIRKAQTNSAERSP